MWHAAQLRLPFDKMSSERDLLPASNPQKSSTRAAKRRLASGPLRQLDVSPESEHGQDEICWQVFVLSSVIALETSGSGTTSPQLSSLIWAPPEDLNRGLVKVNLATKSFSRSFSSL